MPLSDTRTGCCVYIVPALLHGAVLLPFFFIFEYFWWIWLSKEVKLSLSTPWKRAEGVRLQLHSFFRYFPLFWYLLYSSLWWEHNHNDRQIFGKRTKVVIFYKWTGRGNSMTVFTYLLVECTSRENSPKQQGFWVGLHRPEVWRGIRQTTDSWTVRASSSLASVGLLSSALV